MAERLPAALAPGGSPLLKGARIERRGAWEGALYRLATPQEPAPEGLREALGERASAGLEGLLRLGPDDLQALVSGALDVVDSLRQRNAVPPGPEQHPRWLRRDWGRWRAGPGAARRARPPGPLAVQRRRGRGHRRGTAARLAPHAERLAVRRAAPWPCAGPPPGRPRPRGATRRGAGSGPRMGRRTGTRRRTGPRRRPRPCPTPGPPRPAGRGASGKGASGTARRRGARPEGRRAGAQGRGPWGRSRWWRPARRTGRRTGSCGGPWPRRSSG